MSDANPPVDDAELVDDHRDSEDQASPDLFVREDIESRKAHRRHQTTIVSAWRQQQTQDRAIRRTYAHWLMTVMSAQILAINVIFVLIGCSLLKFEPWTANVFITAVFAEVSALVLLVVKYLFPATTDKSLDLIDRFKKEESHESGPGH